MGIETLLLPAGVTLAVALFWIAHYKGIFSHSTSTTTTVQPSVEGQPLVAESVPERITTEPEQEAPAPTQVIMTSAVATAPIAEAPAPFEEPQTAFTNPAISSTALPTDTTAVSNIASPVENIGQMLVIARPKRTRRATKRLPTSGVQKRKRSTRAKPIMTGSESLGISGQQNEANQ
jgi:cytoskeletal protein RodZ